MRFVKDEFYTNVLKMFTGTVGSHILWALSMLVVARLYTPEYFGEGQLFISAASIVAVVATGRYEAAIVVPRYRFQARSLFLFSMALSLVGTVLLLLLLAVLPCTFAQRVGIPEESVLFIPVYMLELCLYALCQAWLVRGKQYTTVAKGLVMFPALYLLFCVMFYFFNVPGHKLILATMLARGVEVFYFGCFLHEEMRTYMHMTTWGRIIEQGKKYIDFPKYMLAGSFIDSATQNLIPFLITAFWGVTTTGYYAMAAQCLSAPAGLIAKSVGDVFRQEGSRLYGRYRECKAFYRKNLRLCAAYSSIICICAYVAIPTLVPLFMGERWEIAGHYVQLMLPMTFATLIASTLSIMYIIARRQKTYLRIQGAFFLSVVLGIGVVGWIGYSIETALTIWGLLIMTVSGISIYGGKKIAEGNSA